MNITINQLLVYFYILVGYSAILSYIVIRFWRPISNAFKLQKLIRFGYGIVRIIRPDATVTEHVIKLDAQVKPIKDGGVYTLDQEAVLLRERKYPEFTFNIDETSPINFRKEFTNYLTECPACNKKITVEVERQKEINPNILDNAMSKAKTEGGLLRMLKEFKTIIIYILIVGAIAMICTYMVYDLKKNLAKLIVDAVRPLLSNMVTTGTTIITK